MENTKNIRRTQEPNIVATGTKSIILETSIADITKLAKVSQVTIYNYFGR